VVIKVSLFILQVVESIYINLYASSSLFISERVSL